MKSEIKIIENWFTVLLLLSITGCTTLQQSNHSLQASGVIEATEVTIAPELSGRVVEIKVEESDEVRNGDELFRLDDTLLLTQRQAAKAALQAASSAVQTAEAGLDSAASTVAEATIALDLSKANSIAELLSALKSLADLNENARLVEATAERDVAAASRLVREATYLLDNFMIPSDQAGLTAIEALSTMKDRLDAARQAFEPYRNASSSDVTRQDRKKDLDKAQGDYDAAVRRFEYETQLKVAQVSLDKALADLEKWKDGPDPAEVAILNARIQAIQEAPRQAEAALESAQVAMKLVESRLAETRDLAEQAQANLDTIDVQIGKLSVTAPVSGVVLTRNIQPGEVVQAGMTTMTLGLLDKLKVTVYLPENRYGQINLGSKASLVADSIPGEAFSATVTRIADKAEYTPRNVQTSEERQTTVYAIELNVEDPAHKLIPGMPVDVTFELNSP